MVLVDTSVWINHFRGIVSEHTDELIRLIDTDKVAVCPTIIMEILSGIADDNFQELSGLLDVYFKLDIEPYEAASKAVNVFRSLRKKGVSIRKHNDCLIAAFALYYDIPLLHQDKDFDRIAEHLPLKIHSPA